MALTACYGNDVGAGEFQHTTGDVAPTWVSAVRRKPFRKHGAVKLVLAADETGSGMLPVSEKDTHRYPKNVAAYSRLAAMSVGVACRTTIPVSGGSERPVFSLSDAIVPLAIVAVNSDGELGLTNAAHSAWIGATTIVADRWYWVQCSYDRVAGTGKLYIDGVLVGQGSLGSGMAKASALHLGSDDNGVSDAKAVTQYFSDVVVSNVYADVFHKTTNVITRWPDRSIDGSVTTVPADQDAHSVIDEKPGPYDDADYIDCEEAAFSFHVGFEPLSFLDAENFEILGVQACMVLESTVEATDLLQIEVESGESSDQGTAVIPASTDASLYMQCMATDPDTAAAWIRAGVNAIGYGAIMDFGEVGSWAHVYHAWLNVAVVGRPMEERLFRPPVGRMAYDRGRR